MGRVLFAWEPGSGYGHLHQMRAIAVALRDLGHETAFAVPDPPGATPVFTESGAVLNAAGATLGPGSGDYNWSDFIGTVSPGILLPGQSETVDYNMTSFASESFTPSNISTQ